MAKRLVIPVLISLMLGTAGGSLQAAWEPDGIPVGPYDRPAPGGNPAGVSDGEGGAIFVWYDGRSGSTELYAQRVDSTGTALWTTNGELVTTTGGIGSSPQAISDGAGGAIIVYAGSDVIAQRIDGNGSPLWGGSLEICGASGYQYYPRLVSDGSGGAIITWYDGRSTSSDVYAQRVDAAGNVRWTTDGVAISTTPDRQTNPNLAADDAGGAIIFWDDDRGTTGWDLYAQRVDSLGVVAWAADGIPFCATTGTQALARPVSDGAGGAIVTWRDNRNGNYDVFAQRIEADGTISWAAGGEEVCTTAYDERGAKIVPDGTGGAIITWYGNNTASDIYAQRIDATGAVLWTTDGVLVRARSGDLLYPVILPDDAGGAFIGWRDFTYHAEGTIYVQRIDGNGDLLWYYQGYPATTSVDHQFSPVMVPDDAGGVYVAWRYAGDNYTELRAQRFTPDGTRLWANGESFCWNGGSQYAREIVMDGLGGVIVGWADTRTISVRQFAQRFDAVGEPLWVAGGVVICDYPSSQSGLQGISDGAGGAIFAWQDFRDGDTWVFAQRVDAAGVPQWTSDGVAVALCDEDEHSVYPVLAVDGSGGVIIAWRDDSGPFGGTVYAQRLDSSGAISWSHGGEIVCTSGRGSGRPLIVSDGIGGAIIAWEDTRGADIDLYAQRLDATGAAVWTVGGLAVTTGPADQLSLALAADGAAGAIAAWSDLLDPEGNIYAQRIGAAGALLWTAGGEAVCTHAGVQFSPQVVTDAAGGAIIVWCDQRVADFDVYAQRLDGAGAVLWSVDGEPVATGLTNPGGVEIVADGAAGAIVAWYAGVYGERDIYAQRVDAEGGIRWSAGGEIVCGAPADQQSSHLAPDGEGGAFVSWTDRRNGSTFEVYASRVTDVGLGPICGVDPTTIEFPDPVPVGTARDTTFTITNLNLGVLSGHVSMSTGDFSIVSGGGSYYLGPGESRVVTVRYEPTGAGDHLGAVETGTYLCGDVALSASAYSCPPGPVMYVDADATGANDGTSWADAFTELRDALAIVDLCEDVEEIWVAEGTYLPTAGTDRGATFTLREGLEIMGGFAGTETSPNDRDHRANPTVLSGDIGVAGDRSDNTWSIVTADGVGTKTLLDGFTITGAMWESGIDHGGGGMLILDANPTLSNLVFSANECVESGGGIYVTGASTPSITNTFFVDNRARNGGGMMAAYGASPWLANVVFSENSAQQYGGGIHVRSADLDLICASFTYNVAEVAGGALASDNGDQPEIASVIIFENDAPAGRDIYNTSTTPRITHSLIAGCGGSGAGWDPAFGGDGGGNLEGDPRWMDPPDDLRLQDGSPAIDAGITWAGLPAVDIAGNPRIQNGTIDMGAYEGGIELIEILVTAVPPGAGLQVMVDGQTWTESRTFFSETGLTHEIGVTTPQLIGDEIWSFSHWNDAGDTTHVITVGTEAAHYDAHFTSAVAWAAIDSIVDVPGDQGGWANLHFGRSFYDRAGETEHPIERYDIHRRVDDPAKAAELLAAGKAAVGPAGAPPGTWTVVGNVSAQQEDHYIRLVPTVGDSSATIPWSVYYVSAHTTAPAVFFDSPPDSGYSTDDIAPAVPGGLLLAGDMLSWDDPVDADFAHFTVYGSATDHLDGSETLIDHTIDTSLDLAGRSHFFYLVTATDAAGNESEAAPYDAVSGVPGGLPRRYALHQCVPNPFNPSTTIRYELPAAAPVRLRIYDLSGRLVRTLLSGELVAAGRGEAVWRGRDDAGRAAAAGVYFYRLDAGEFKDTKRMTLVK